MTDIKKSGSEEGSSYGVYKDYFAKNKSVQNGSESIQKSDLEAYLKKQSPNLSNLLKQIDRMLTFELDSNSKTQLQATQTIIKSVLEEIESLAKLTGEAKEKKIAEIRNKLGPLDIGGGEKTQQSFEKVHAAHEKLDSAIHQLDAKRKQSHS